MLDLSELREAVLNQPAAYYPHQDTNRILDQVLHSPIVFLESENSFSLNGRFINGVITLSAPRDLDHDEIAVEINRLIDANVLPIEGDDLLIYDVFTGFEDTLPDYQLVYLTCMTTNPGAFDLESDTLFP